MTGLKENNIILSTHELTRQVEGVALVDSVSVEIECGLVVAVAGPSGAGKSSFLRLLNRLDEPTSGTVCIHGEDYRSISPRQLRQKVGMVLQAPYLFQGSVADNLRFGPEQRGEKLPQERVEMLLERVGLGGYAGRDINRLSGGEAQRVSLARTLANSPEVLLLDEPTSALDDTTRREVEELLQGIISDESLTCLIVTHNLTQARRLASHALLLRGGRMVQFGPLEEVLDA